MQFRIPVEKIMHALQEIGEFPYAPPVDEHSAPERLWNGPTLFVKGERSKYINRHNIPLCKAYFPQVCSSKFFRRATGANPKHQVHLSTPSRRSFSSKGYVYLLI